MENSPEKRLQALKKLTQLMDAQFSFLGFRFGLDPLLGLIPGIGDSISPLVSIYILYEAYQLGLPTFQLMRMVSNIILDTMLGTIPLIGDIFDFGFKSHQKNYKIIEQYLSQNKHPKRKIIA